MSGGTHPSMDGADNTAVHCGNHVRHCDNCHSSWQLVPSPAGLPQRRWDGSSVR
ncbi:hypothetical protein JCM18909_3506 [Cutibacterium acnes JCM 18909]|nr:hypothetical protein JCM18909_3506 [Cutibacterium acnes JCM 18909]